MELIFRNYILYKYGMVESYFHVVSLISLLQAFPSISNSLLLMLLSVFT